MGVQIPHGNGQFLGEGASHCKVYGTCVKTVQPIKMPFLVVGSDRPRNHKLDGGPGSPHGKGQFWGKGVPIVKYKDFLP